jgi:hypothetical protein
MPQYNVTLPDGSTHQVNVDAGATPEDFAHIEQQLSGPRAGGAAPAYVPALAEAPATDPYASSSPVEAASTPEMESATPPPTPGPKPPPAWHIPIADQPTQESGWGAALWHIPRELGKSVNAAGQALSDVGALAADVYTGGDWSRANLSTLKDVAAAAEAPMAVIPATAPYVWPGLVAGAATRGAGYSEPTAETVGAGVNLAAGGIGLGKSFVQARRASDITGLFERFGGVTPRVAGEAVQSEFPAAATADIAKATEPTYGAMKEFASETPMPAEAEYNLVKKLEAAQEKYSGPGELTPTERDVAKKVLKNVADPDTGPTTLGQLDEHYNELAGNVPRGRGSAVRTAIDQAMQDTVEGTPAQPLLEAGKAAYREPTGPAAVAEMRGDILGTTRGVPEAEKAFKIAGGEQWTDPVRATIAKRVLSPEAWDKFAKAFRGDLLTAAHGKIEKAAEFWKQIDPAVQALYDPTGEFGAKLARGARIAASGKGVGAAARTASALAGMGEFAMGHFGPGWALMTGGRSLPLAKYAGLGIEAARTGWPALVKGGLGTAAQLSQVTPTPPPTHPDLTSTTESPPETTETPTEAPPSEAPTPPAPQAPRPPSRTASLPFDREIQAVAQVTGVPPELLHAVMQQESSYNPRAVGPPNHTGELARGPMQILPSQFEKYRGRVEQLNGRKGDVADPLDNIVAGALHLRDDLDASQGDLAGTLGRYYGARDPRYIGSVALKLRRLGIDVRLPGGQQPTAVARRPAMPSTAAQLAYIPALNVPGLRAGYGG